MPKCRYKFCPVPTFITNIIFIIFSISASICFVVLSWKNYSLNQNLREFYKKKVKEINKNAGGLIIESAIRYYTAYDFNISTNLKEHKALSYINSTFSEPEPKNNTYYIRYIKMVLRLQDGPFGIYSRIKGIELLIGDLGIFSFANKLLLTENVDKIYDSKLIFALFFYGLNAIALFTFGGIFMTCNCINNSLILFSYYFEAAVLMPVGVILGPCIFENKRKIITFYSTLLSAKKTVLLLTFIYILAQYSNESYDENQLVSQDKLEFENYFKINREENNKYGKYGILLLFISTVTSILVSLVWGHRGMRMVVLECCKKKVNPPLHPVNRKSTLKKTTTNTQQNKEFDLKESSDNSINNIIENKENKENLLDKNEEKKEEDLEDGGWEEDWEPEKDEDEVDEMLF